MNHLSYFSFYWVFHVTGLTQQAALACGSKVLFFFMPVIFALWGENDRQE
jgi:hypothetical protein